MQRRTLLKAIAGLTGWAFIGQTALAYQTSPDATNLNKTVFSEKDIRLLDEIAETIIPQTDTPGAKAAGCGAAMAVMVHDCYTKAERDMFVLGLKQLNNECQQLYQQDFITLADNDKQALLNQLDASAKKFNRNGQTSATLPHYFTLFKQLTLFCFFTSKVGATQVLRYSAIPGKYDGDLDYQPGDKAWAT
ncbi:gluconate 2-dehydrogenase subunit 3 family protein [Gayadomonas joobiniege]|uniref:gluconate 2-dehydrogenase subunit 3 family protein n=1 Tax=Gayadomonas joobiniege TaxID=1234606 RepID=UPI00037F51B2|nr:gluconate 2-dehydrogenase subunit 3 family protein [Gayadomonas joobiniege]